MIKNKLQRELYNYLLKNIGDYTTSNTFTPVLLNKTDFRNYSVRQLKYNLNKLCKMDIGIYEAYEINKNYCYSIGYYHLKTLK